MSELEERTLQKIGSDGERDDDDDDDGDDDDD